MAKRGFLERAFEGLARFGLPLIKETHRSLLTNAFEEFLVEMEEEIREDLGVRNGRAVVRILRYRFRQWLREGPPERLEEEEEGEEEEYEYEEDDPFQGMAIDSPSDPWS